MVHRDGHRCLLEHFGTHQAIEGSETIGILGGEGIPREDHFLNDVEWMVLPMKWDIPAVLSRGRA